MLEIFLEEAREVLSQAQEALAELEVTPDDADHLTVVRRAFHTLKGSGRMVGLNDFGEAAWSCEQLYNAWLGEHKPASEDLRQFTDQALGYLAEWVDEISQRLPVSHISAPVSAAAHALRLEGEWIGVTESPASSRFAPAVPPAAEPVAPAASGPDAAPTPNWERTEVMPAPSLPASEMPASSLGSLDFTLDLSSLDAPARAPVPAEARNSGFAPTLFGASPLAGSSEGAAQCAWCARGPGPGPFSRRRLRRHRCPRHHRNLAALGTHPCRPGIAAGL